MELALIFLTFIIAILSPLLFWLLLKWLIPLSLPVLVLFAACIFFLIVLCFCWLIPSWREQLKKRLMIWFNKVLRKKADEPATPSFGGWEYDPDPSSNGINPENSSNKSRNRRRKLQTFVLILTIFTLLLPKIPEAGSWYYKGIKKVIRLINPPEQGIELKPTSQPTQQFSHPVIILKKKGETPGIKPPPELSDKQKRSRYRIDINGDIDRESMEEAEKLFYADAYFKRGDYLRRIGKHTEALKAFVLAVSLNPKLSEKIHQM